MKLNKLTFNTNDNAAYTRPVFCIVMDGIGIAPDTAANAVKLVYAVHRTFPLAHKQVCFFFVFGLSYKLCENFFCL